MASTVRGEAAAARTLGPADTPSSLAGEGGGGDEHVGGGDCAGAAGLGATPMHTGPWNRKGRPCRSGGDCGERSSCCPRRKAGSFVGWLMRGVLTGEEDREEDGVK